MEATAPRKILKTDIIYPFKAIWAFVLANLMLGLMITLAFNLKWIDNFEEFGIQVLWGATISITQWTGHAFISALLDRRISWLEAPTLRALVTFFAIVTYTVIAYVLVSIVIRTILGIPMPSDIFRFILNESILPLILSFVIAGTAAARGFYTNWKQSELRAAKLKAEMLTYRYETLRNQINPHFLFNSFNVLTGLVYENQDLAAEFIRQLSDLYRYVLDSREKETVTLAEELDFIEGFIFLLETRFEGKLNITVELEPGADEMIVPMTLQLLLENAVKHNTASKKKPLTVSVHRVGEYVEVRNQLQRRTVGDESKKMGLANIRQQYAHLSNQKIEVGETEDEFYVRVPLLKPNSK